MKRFEAKRNAGILLFVRGKSNGGWRRVEDILIV